MNMNILQLKLTILILRKASHGRLYKGILSLTILMHNDINKYTYNNYNI